MDRRSTWRGGYPTAPRSVRGHGLATDHAITLVIRHCANLTVIKLSFYNDDTGKCVLLRVI